MMTLSRSLLFAVLFAACSSTASLGQDFGDLQLPGGLDEGFGFGNPATDKQVTLWSIFKVNRDTGEAEVTVTAEIIDGWHLFSITQPDGGPIRSEIKLRLPEGATQVQSWEPSSDPERHFDKEAFNMEVEEHRGQISWTALFEFPADFDVETLKPEIQFSGQTCTDGVGQCINIEETLISDFAGYVEAAALVTEYQPKESHVKFTGHINPKQAKAGQLVQLVITAESLGDYHIYSRKNEQKKGSISAPTLIALTKRNGWNAAEPVVSTPPKKMETGISSEPTVEYHDGTVSWTIEVEVPKDTEPGDYNLEGLIGFQTCNESSCDLPMAAAFEGTFTVAKKAAEGKSSLAFQEYVVEKGDAYAAVNKLSKNMKWGIGGAREPASASQLISWMFTAFLAGLILNVMPCVLPVIGLKVLSLVSQAGANRFQIFFLNFWLAVGVMFVFLTLATLAVVFGLAWGEQFTNHWFTIAMISVVFVFGLSFLGVWEVPIPGFASTAEANKLSEREGAIGAFFKGVLSTILATPCAGPLLVPAVAWAMSQPAVTTYSMFAAMGLGMASPYLIIGLFPSAVKLLPKPGNWMVTFKELMGFVMIGTAVWLFYTLADEYRVPMAAFAVFLGFFCWWIGRIPAGSERHHTAKGWILATGMLAIGGVFSFWALTAPKHELEWQPFDRVAIEDQADEGTPVFVDFTADW